MSLELVLILNQKNSTEIFQLIGTQMHIRKHIRVYSSDSCNVISTSITKILGISKSKQEAYDSFL